MKLQQLRYVLEVVRHDLNVTAAANDLYTSQSGVSRQIRLLEDELGVDIFVRRGKHFSRVTPAGRLIVEKAEAVWREVEAIKGVADEYRHQSRGILSVATTHTQVRYALPGPFAALRESYPDLNLRIRQGSTEQIGAMASSGEVDFAIAPEAMDHFPELVMMPCYSWNRCAVVPRQHPLAQRKRIEREDLESHPIITYDAGFRERLPLLGSASESAPEDASEDDDNLNIVMSAVDTDVIKRYARLGFGVGLIASMAFEPEEDADLVAIDVGHLFQPSTVYIGCRRATFLRQYMIDFVGLFAPHLTPDLINAAFAAPSPAACAKLFEQIELPQR